MNLHLRACALITLISCMASAPILAQVPPAPAATASTPAPALAPSAGSDISAITPTDPLKEAEIRKLLAVTGTVKMVDQMKKQMFASFRQHAAMLPQEFWDRMDKDMDSQQLINKMIPIYDKYYTLDDLRALNAFYQTPTGQHLLQAQPLIIKDSMAAGQQWGRQAGLKVMLEMQNYQQRMSTTPPPSNSTPQPAAPAPSTAPSP